MRSSTAFLLRFGAAGLVCLAGSPCRADAIADRSDSSLATRSVTVSWADLDLTKPAGVRALYRRIKAAAHVACTALEEDRLFEPLFARSCFDQAVDAAVAKVSDARLLTLHGAATRRSEPSGQ